MKLWMEYEMDLVESSPLKYKRPNIIFIHMESWDGRVLGCLEHPAMRKATPNIDLLAKRGTLFRNTYCSHPICCPSRANMWSGLYTHHCESWNNYKGLSLNVNTLITNLRDNGYQTASEKGGFGKHDYTSGGHSQLARVTAWTGPANIRLPVYRMKSPEILPGNIEYVHKKDWDNVERAKTFMKYHSNNNRPFFLYIGMTCVHPPFVTSHKWLDMVDVEAVDVPPKDRSIHPVMEYQRIVKNWMHGFSPSTIRKTRSIYYAMCAEADAIVGKIIDEIDQLNLEGNTYIIFSSDHGENNMEHNQFYKMNMYESSVRVPFIIVGPRIRKNVIINNPVSLIDVYPTVMDIAGLECPKGLDGESLMPILKGQTSITRNWAFATFTGSSSNTSMFMFRKDDWKYIAYPGYEPQLFNLVDDPDEVQNLSKTKPEIVKFLDGELRTIVDYDSIHQLVLKYDKLSFLKWRKQIQSLPILLKEYGANIKHADYQQIMANCYMGWNQDIDSKLERWLQNI